MGSYIAEPPRCQSHLCLVKIAVLLRVVRAMQRYEALICSPSGRSLKLRPRRIVGLRLATGFGSQAVWKRYFFLESSLASTYSKLDLPRTET